MHFLSCGLSSLLESLIVSGKQLFCEVSCCHSPNSAGLAIYCCPVRLSAAAHVWKRHKTFSRMLPSSVINRFPHTVTCKAAMPLVQEWQLPCLKSLCIAVKQELQALQQDSQATVSTLVTQSSSAVICTNSWTAQYNTWLLIV